MKLPHQSYKHFTNAKALINEDSILTLEVADEKICYQLVNSEGKGAFGEVFKAHLLNQLGKPIEDKVFAIKIFHDKTKFNLSEIEYFNEFYFTEHLIETDKQVYWVTQFLEGENLYDEKIIEELSAANTVTFKTVITLNSAIQNASLLFRIQLLASICASLNDMHHQKVKRLALAHGDVRGPNIRFKFDELRQYFLIHILDFGLTEYITDNHHDLKDSESCGHLNYIAPELIDHSRGVKSDIFAFALIMLIVLGAKNPFFYRNQFKIEDVLFFKQTFSFDGIFEHYSAKEAETEIKTLLIAFLHKMLSEDHEKRPDPDEVLTFLNTSFLILKTENQLESRLPYLTRLILLQQGVWNKTIPRIKSDQKLDETPEDKRNNTEELFLTFASYPFDHNLVACKMIYSQYQKKALNEAEIYKIFFKEHHISLTKSPGEDRKVNSLFFKLRAEKPHYEDSPRVLKCSGNGYVV